MILASVPVVALAFSLVGLAVVAIDPRHRRGAILPAVSAATCVIGSVALLIAAAFRESMPHDPCCGVAAWHDPPRTSCGRPGLADLEWAPEFPGVVVAGFLLGGHRRARPVSDPAGGTFGS